MLGELLCWMEKLKTYVKTLTASGPRFSKFLHVMPAGTKADMDLVCFIASSINLGMKGVKAHWWNAVCVGRCLFS